MAAAAAATHGIAGLLRRIIKDFIPHHVGPRTKGYGRQSHVQNGTSLAYGGLRNDNDHDTMATLSSEGS